MAGREGLRGWAAAHTATISKAYFCMYSVGSVFLLPFVNVFYRHLGFREELIGVLCALKPWTAAPAGSLIGSLADSTKRHFVVLMAVYLVAFLGRSRMAFFTGFGIQLAIALVTEAAASPQGALVDAAVMASATDDGGYGKIRSWASIGWGCTAPIAGWVVAHFGLDAAFLCFTVLVGITLIPAALLPMDVLSAGKAGAGASQARRSSRDSTARLSFKDGSDGKLGQGSEDGGPIAVHVSGGSQTGGAREGGGLKAGPLGGQPLAKSWSIGASLAAPSGGADTGYSSSPAPISLVADCSSAAATAALASPQHPLLAAADRSDSPCPSPSVLPAANGRAVSTSPLEICATAGSKARLVAPAAGSGSDPAAGIQEASVWQGVKGLFADVHVAAFMWTAFLMGIGNGVIGYLFLFLDEIGVTGTLMGLCLSANCAAEVPVFFYSGRILERLGVERALHVAMGCYILRLCCYLALPLLPSPWFVLGAELLQGATFALAWAAGTVHVKRISPPHLRSTVQSIFQGLYTGLGAGLGGLAGGLLYGKFGSAALFRTAALTLAAGWLATVAALRAWGSKGSGHSAGASAPAAEAGAYRQPGTRASSEEAEDAALLRA